MFILIFNQLLKMLIIMIIAFICYKVKVVNQEGNKMCSNLLLTVVNPCLVITVYQIDFDFALARNLFLAFVAAIVSHLIAIAAARILIPKKNNPEWSIERFAAIYSNCGFIGIPLVNSVLGSEGVFFISAYMAVFNLLSWTHGLGLLKNGFSIRYLKEGFLSPMFLATSASILMFFIQIRIPPVMFDSLEYIASMNTPLAMMIAGFSIAQADLKKLFFNLNIYRTSLIKLIVYPGLVLLLLTFVPLDRTIAYTTLIAASCPTAATATMMAMKFDRNYTYSSEIFSFTTVLSMLTIPLIMLLAGYLI